MLAKGFMEQCKQKKHMEIKITYIEGNCFST